MFLNSVIFLSLWSKFLVWKSCQSIKFEITIKIFKNVFYSYPGFKYVQATCINTRLCIDIFTKYI